MCCLWGGGRGEVMEVMEHLLRGFEVRKCLFRCVRVILCCPYRSTLTCTSDFALASPSEPDRWIDARKGVAAGNCPLPALNTSSSLLWSPPRPKPPHPVPPTYHLRQLTGTGAPTEGAVAWPPLFSGKAVLCMVSLWCVVFCNDCKTGYVTEMQVMQHQHRNGLWKCCLEYLEHQLHQGKTVNNLVTMAKEGMKQSSRFSLASTCPGLIGKSMPI